MRATLLSALAAVLSLISLRPAPADDVLAEKPFLSVSWGNYSASAVCVATDGRESLVLSNNHVFAHQLIPGGEFPLANYPLKAFVHSVDGKKTWAAVAVAGETDSDLALVVVSGAIPAAVLANEDAKAGTAVWHRGHGSGGGVGKVLAPLCVAPACCVFAADLRSVNGDSGAGIFDDSGRVVAVNCGRHALDPGSPLRGTPASAIRAAIKRLRGKIPAGLVPG